MKQFVQNLQAHPIASRLVLISGLALPLSFGLQTSQAQSFSTGFETSYGYPAAPAAFTTTTPVNSSTASIPFGSGNAEGWTSSSSTSAGYLVATTASGSYAGGQALGSANPTSSPGAGQSYIGALNPGLSGITQLQFDVMTPTVGNGAQVGLAGWYDANGDGMFNQTAETGVFAGITSSQQFGIRGANFGTVDNSGVAPVANDWYQITLTYSYLNSGNAGNSATIGVYNLTTGSAVNLGGVGGDLTDTGASVFGTENPSTDLGIVTRVSGPALLDSLEATPAPEPTSASMIVGGFAVLFALRHRWARSV